MKQLRHAVIIAAALAVPMLAATAQPWAGGPGGYGPGMMGPYGYGPGMMYGSAGGYSYGPGMMFGYGPSYGYAGPQADAAKVDAAAKEALGKATEGTIWTNPAGVKLTPILVDNQVVGQLWQNADLKTIEIGSYWTGPWGVGVQLLKDGQVVGMLWVKVS